MQDNLNNMEKDITPQTVADNKKTAVAVTVNDVNKPINPPVQTAVSIDADKISPFQGTSVSSISTDQKEYFEGEQISGTDPMEIAAQAQSDMDRYWQSSKSIIPKVADDIIKGAGYVGGAFVGAVTGADIADSANHNFVTELGTDINHFLSGVLGIEKIYHTRDFTNSTSVLYKTFGEGGETITDALAFLASAYVPGAAFSKLGLGMKLAKGASKLAKLTSRANRLAKLGKLKQARTLMEEVKNLTAKGVKSYEDVAAESTKAANIIAKNAENIARVTDFGLMHTYNIVSESGFEAKGAADSVVAAHLWDADKKGNLITQTESDKLRKDAWDKSFGWNLALLSVTNLPESAAIFKLTNKARATKALARKWKALKGTSDKMTKVNKAIFHSKNMALTMFSEGIAEEGGQLGIENYTKNNAGKDITTIEATEQIFKNVIDNFSTLEGKTSMFVGALMGGLFGTGSTIQEYNDIKTNGTAHFLAMQSTKDAMSAYKNNIFKTNEDGSFVNGEPEFDIPAMQAMVDELKKRDIFKATAMEAAMQSGSETLHNFIVGKDFESIIADSVLNDANLQDLNDDIDFFAGEQESLVKALEPGIEKDELTKQIEKRKQLFRKKAQELISVYKNAKGKAFEMYAEGKIKKEEIPQYAHEIYMYDVQARSAIRLMHDYTNEMANFEDEHGLTKSREYNRSVANLKYKQQTVKLIKQDVSKLEKKLTEAKSETEKDKIQLALDEANEQLKTYSNLEEQARTSTFKLAKELTGTKRPQYSYRVDNGKPMTPDLYNEYMYKASMIGNIEEIGVQSIEARQAFDDNVKLKELIDKRVEDNNNKINGVKDKFAKVNDETILKNINKTNTLADLEALKAIAHEKGGKFKKAYSNKLAELKEIAKTEQDKKDGNKTTNPAETPTPKAPEKEAKTETEETPDASDDTKGETVEQLLLQKLREAVPGMIDPYNKDAIAVGIVGAQASIYTEDKSNVRKYAMAVFFRGFLNNDVKNSAKTALSYINKLPDHTFTEADHKVYNEAKAVIDTYFKEFKTILDEVETTKAKLPTQDDIEDTNDTTETKAKSNPTGVITAYIPMFHTRKDWNNYLTKQKVKVLKAVQKLKNGAKVTLKRGKKKYQGKYTIEMVVDGTTIGNVQSLEHVAAEVNMYTEIKESVGGDNLNDWLLKARDVTDGEFKTLLGELGIKFNELTDKEQNAVMAIARRSKFSENGKVTDTPVVQFNNWIDIMSSELAVVTDLWNTIDGTTELEWKGDTVSNGGFVAGTPILASEEGVVDFENDTFVFFRNGNPYDVRTGEVMSNIPTRYEDESGLIYMYTNKSLSGDKMLVSLKPQPLTKSERKHLRSQVQVFIDAFLGEDKINSKSDTDEQQAALEEISKLILEQDDKEGGSKYASHISNVKDGKGFVFTLGIPSKTKVQIQFKVDGNSRKVFIYEIDENNKKRTVSYDNNSQAFNETLESYFESMKSNASVSRMKESDEYFKEAIGRMGFPYEPVYDDNNKIISFTQPYGNGNNTNQQLRVRIKNNEHAAEVNKQKVDDSLASPLGVQQESTNDNTTAQTETTNDEIAEKDKTPSYEEWIIEQIKNTKEFHKGIPIVKHHNLKASNGELSAARFDRGNNVILLNRPLLKTKYDSQAWLNPREQADGSKTDVLSSDLFKDYETFESFELEHEFQHSLLSKEEFDQLHAMDRTIGEYESYINQKALEALGLIKNEVKDSSETVSGDTKTVEVKVDIEKPKTKKKKRVPTNINDLTSKKSTQYKENNIEDRKSKLKSEIQTEITDEEFDIINNVMNAVYDYPNADKIYDIVASNKLRGILDIINGITSIETIEGKDMYDVGMALFITKLAAEGKYKQSTNTRFIADALGMMFSNQGSEFNSKEFNAANMAEEALDILNDIELQYDNRAKLSDIIDMQVEDNRSELDKYNEAQASSNGEFLSKAGLEYNFKKLIKFLIAKAKEFLEVVKAFKGESIKDIFTNPNMETNIMIKPLAMANKDFIIKQLKKAGAIITNEKTVKATSNQIASHYDNIKNESYFGDTVDYYTGKDIHVMSIKINKKNLKRLNILLGNSHGFAQDATSLRTYVVGNSWKQLMNETGVLDNGIHISSSPESAKRENDIWFNNGELEYNRKWYNIGMSNRNTTVSSKELNKMFKDFNFHTNNSTYNDAIGKIYPNTDILGNTIIVDILDETIINNIGNAIGLVKNLTVSKNLEQGIITYKFETMNGKIGTVDVRTETNLIQNFDKSQLPTSIDTKGAIPYGKMFKQMRENLKQNTVAIRLLDKAEQDYYANNITPNVKMFSMLGGFETIERINVKKATNWLHKYVPQADIRLAEGLIRAADGSLNYGLTQGSIVALSDEATFGTEYHEALHFVLDNLVSTEARDRMINEIQIVYGLDSIEQAHEAFADLYRSYVIDNTINESPKGVQEMAPFIHTLLDVIKSIPEVETLFKDIHQGKYSSTSITKEAAETRYSKINKLLYNQTRFGFTLNELHNAENLLTGLFLESLESDSRITDENGNAKLIRDLTNGERLYNYTVNGNILYDDLSMEEQNTLAEQDNHTPVHSNDIIQVMIDKLALVQQEAYDEWNDTEEGSKEEIEADNRIKNVERIAAQLNDFKNDPNDVNLMHDIVRKIKQVHGYSFKTIQELETAGQLSKLDTASYNEGVVTATQLMGETAISIDPDTTFNPIVKQAIAKIKQIENVYENNKKVGTQYKLNPLTKQPMYVDFGTFFPKFVNLMVGVKTSEQLQARIDKHLEYLPELSQINELLKSKDGTYTLKQALLANLNAKLSSEHFVDVNDNYKIKNKSKPGSYRFSDRWSSNLRKLHKNTRRVNAKHEQFTKGVNKVTSMVANNAPIMQVLEQYAKVCTIYGMNFSKDELYHYAFDDNNSLSNIMTNKPIKNYNSKKDMAKITSTVGMILNRLIEVDATLVKNSKLKSVKKTIDGKDVYVEPEFDNYGDLNSIAKVKDLYGKEGIKLSYLDVKDNQKNQITKINQIGDFINFIKGESDAKVLEHLTALTKDPSMKYSNMLVSIVDNKGNIKHHGLLILQPDGSYMLNKKYIANLEYGIIGGIYNGKDTRKGLYREGNDLDWIVQKVAYYFNNSSTKGFTQMPGMIPGDSSNNYVWTVSKYNSAITINDDKRATLSKESTLGKAVINMFNQEVVRMKEAEQMLFDRVTGKGFVFKKGINERYLNGTGFRKDYHYALNNDGTKTFLNKDKHGNLIPTGLVFKFHNFTKFNDLIDPRTGIFDENSVWFKEKFGDKTLEDIILTKFTDEMIEEYLELNEELKIIISKVAPKHNNTLDILNMLINQRMHNIEMQNMFTGLSSELPGGYNKNKVFTLSKKGRLQATVRNKSSVQGGTAGTLLNEHGESINVKVNYVVHKDLRRNSNSIELIKKKVVEQLLKEGYVAGTETYNKQLKLISKGLEGIEVSDGGALGTLNRWVEVQKSLGRWDEFKHLFKEPKPRYSKKTGKRMEGRFTYEFKDDLSVLDAVKTLDAVKPVYTKRDITELKDLDGNTHSQLKQEFIKYAWFPLTDFLVENNPDLKRLKDWMEANDVDEMGPMTTEKQGTDYIGNIAYTAEDEKANSEHKEGRLIPADDNGDILDNLIVKQTNFEDYRIQLEINAHAQDAENKLGVQILKSIISNILPNMDYNGKSGTDIINEHFSTLDDIFEFDRQDLEASLNIEKSGFKTYSSDVSEIKNIILNELERTGVTEDMKLLMNIENGQFENSLDVSDQANKILSVLNAQYTNKYKATKFPGSHLTLMPDTGFKPSSMLTEDLFKKHMENLGVDYANEDFSELKIREVNGVLIADCLMPAFTKDFLDKNGKPIDITTIDPKLLQVMGYRIPNTGKHSNVVLNIVGFLPAEVGGLLITPADFVGRTGWDFDIDSVYMMNRLHMENSDKESEIKFVPLEDTSYSTYKRNRLKELKPIMKNTTEAKRIKELNNILKALNTKLNRYDDSYSFKLKDDEGNDIAREDAPIFDRKAATKSYLSNERKAEVLGNMVQLEQQIAVTKEQLREANEAYIALLEDKGLLHTNNEGFKSKSATLNKLFDLWYDIQTSDNHLIEGMSVSDFTNNNAARDDLGEIIDNKSENANNPVSNVYQRNVYSKAVMDKDNLAIFANYSSMINIHQITNTFIRSAPMYITKKSLNLNFDIITKVNKVAMAKKYGVDSKITIKELKALQSKSNDDTIQRFANNYIHPSKNNLKVLKEQLKNGESIQVINHKIGKSLNGTTLNVQGQLITHVLSEDIDNAADAIKDYLPQGLTTYTKDVYSFIKARGGTANLAVLLTNQPFIQYIANITQEDKRLDNSSDNKGGVRLAKQHLISQAIQENPNLLNDVIAAQVIKENADVVIAFKKTGKIKFITNKAMNLIFDYIAGDIDNFTEENLEQQIKDFHKTGVMDVHVQAATFNYYLNLLQAAQALTQANQLLNLDKKEIGNNYNNTFNTLDKIEEHIQDYYQNKVFPTGQIFPEVVLENGDFGSLIAAVFPTIHKKVLESNALKQYLELNKSIDGFDFNKATTLIQQNGYSDISVYPGIETKFINGNLSVQSLASTFMITENKALRDQTTRFIAKLFKANRNNNEQELERMQAEMINFTLASLSGTKIQDMVDSKLFSYNEDVSKLANETYEEIQDYITNNPSISEHHPFKYIDRGDKIDNFNKTTIILKSNPIETDELNLVHAEINKLFNSDDELAKTLYNNIVVLSFLKSGFRQDYTRLSNFVTEHVKEYYEIHKNINENKNTFNAIPAMAQTMGKAIKSNFMINNFHNNIIAPIVNDIKTEINNELMITNKFTTSNGGRTLTIAIKNIKKHPAFASKTGYIKRIVKGYDFNNPTAPIEYNVFVLTDTSPTKLTYELIATSNTAKTKLSDSNIYNRVSLEMLDDVADKEYEKLPYDVTETNNTQLNDIYFNMNMPTETRINKEFKNRCK